MYEQAVNRDCRIKSSSDILNLNRFIKFKRGCAQVEKIYGLVQW